MKKPSKKVKRVITGFLAILVCAIAAFIVLHSSPQLAIRSVMFRGAVERHNLYEMKAVLASQYRFKKDPTIRSPLVDVPEGDGTVYGVTVVGGTGTAFYLVDKHGFLYLAKYFGGE